MANPICLSPLKFYDSLAKQSHRKSYAYGHISPLITKTGWIPPFQFVIPTQLYTDGGNISEIKIFDAKTDNFVTDVPRDYIAGGIIGGDKNVIAVDDDYVDHYITKFLNNPIHLNAGEKLYYKADLPVGSFMLYANGVRLNEVNILIANHYYEYVATSEVTVDSIAFYHSAEGHLTREITLYSKSGNFDILTIDGYKVLIHLGNTKLEGLSEGLYYIKIASDNGGIWTYYSEVFCFDNVTKDCLELEYWNETGNFAIKNGVIAFPSNFHFKLLLKGEIGKPEYNFEEESTKRLGYVYIESQVSKKTYKFNTVVPEYICDALRIVRLCDNKIIRCKDDEYEAISFEMEADWQTQGDLASVTCEFETDNVIANIGGFVPDKLGGDYNNDYNEDFDKE